MKLKERGIQTEMAQPEEQSSQKRRTTSTQRKRETIVRTYQEPVLPKLAKILFISMLVLTAVMAAVDLKNGLLHLSQMGWLWLLRNVSQTGLTVWLAYTVVLAVTCALGMRQNVRVTRRKAREGDPESWTREDAARCARAARRLNRPYRIYLLCAVIGVAVWLSLFAAARLLI
jgi:hypothetical protein